MANQLFPYNNAVPQAEQKISPTQNPILNNFQSINELINVNHVGFADPVNYGKHTITTFPIQVSSPGTGTSEMILYAASATTANGIELFYQYPSNGSIVQLTGNNSNNGTGSASSSGWGYLVGGLLLKWGTTTVGGVITYPTGGSIPAYSTAVYNVQTSQQGIYSTLYVSNLTTTSFTLSKTGTLTPAVIWYAIGV